MKTQNEDVRISAREAVDWSNKNGYNWTPVATLLASEIDANGLAETLLELYFEVAEAAAYSNVGRNNALASVSGAHLYYLRLVIEALQGMSDPAVDLVGLQVKTKMLY